MVPTAAGLPVGRSGWTLRPVTRKRQRGLYLSLTSLAVAWLVAWTGFTVSRRMEPTPDKVHRLLSGTSLAGLSPADRRAALSRLARLLNALSIEDRRTARLYPAWQGWLAEMTDDEKLELLDATLPSGVGQMLARFEELPEEQRLRALSDAFRRLQEARDTDDAADPGSTGETAGDPGDTNQVAILTPELQRRAVQTGLNAFYAESSAQTKAELAPLLEELQRGMQGGRLFRPRRRPESSP